MENEREERDPGDLSGIGIVHVRDREEEEGERFERQTIERELSKLAGWCTDVARIVSEYHARDLYDTMAELALSGHVFMSHVIETLDNCRESLRPIKALHFYCTCIGGFGFGLHYPDGGSLFFVSCRKGVLGWFRRNKRPENRAWFRYRDEVSNSKPGWVRHDNDTGHEEEWQEKEEEDWVPLDPATMGAVMRSEDAVSPEEALLVCYGKDVAIGPCCCHGTNTKLLLNHVLPLDKDLKGLRQRIPGPRWYRIVREPHHPDVVGRQRSSCEIF